MRNAIIIERKSMLLIMLSILVSCSPDLEVYTDYYAQPNVYCQVDPTDSFCYVTISKSYQTTVDANSVLHQGDELAINDAEITLEAWGNGYRAWKTNFNLVDTLEFDSSKGIHARSIYKSDKVLDFEDPLTYGASETWIYEDFRLIISTPQFDQIIYSKAHIINAPKIIFPVTPMGVNLYGNEKSYFEFRINDEEVKHADFICDFYYQEFIDGWHNKKVQLVLKKDIPIAENLVIRLYDDSFFNKLVKAIGDNPYVVARRLKHMDYTLRTSDIYFNNYYSNNNSGYNSDYSFYTNITNGMGLFSVKRKATVENLVFDRITSDSLRTSRKTRHLNFRMW